MTMTLEQVRHRLDEWGCSSLGQVQLPTAYLRQWRDAIDAHLTQPAQAVDGATVCAERLAPSAPGDGGAV